MIFERIKAIKPQKFDVKNGDDAYAEYIGKLPTHAHAGNLFAIIGTVAAAVTVVIGVSLWAIIGSGVRGTPNDDPVVIAPSDEGNDTKNDKTPSVDTEPEVADPVPDNNDTVIDKPQTGDGTWPPQENESDPIKPQESQTNDTKPPVNTTTNPNDTKPPVNTTTNPNDDNCIIKIKWGNTLYISNDEFACGTHSSRQEEARELADIIKNAKYTKTDCSCRGCYNVYFDASRAADYAIYTSEAVSTVHIKSKDGECQFNKQDSERIIYLLKQVLIGDNEGYQMTPQYVTEYQPMFDSFYNDYGNKENPVTVRYLPDIFSDSFFTFYGNDSVKLKNLLESFDYSAPTCRCACNFGVSFENVSLEGRESFTSEYRIALERDAKRAHVKTDKGTHFLTDSELQLICDIFFINLNDSTGGPYSNMYVVPAIPKQPIEITIGDKTHIVPPNINLVYAFQFDNKYTEDFCDCTKTYATVKINDIVYSICTCENARITSPCGTKRINEAYVKSICELLDKYILENTEKGEA